MACPKLSTNDESPTLTLWRPIMNGKTNEMVWKVDGNHVYPVDALREHVVTDCWCGPVDDDGIVVHNSLDGREMYERGVRKMS